jgi:dCMP deaminase
MKNKTEYYLGLAKEASRASSCLKSHFGAVIVKNDAVIGVGYNGPARGVPHCNPCRRENDPSGTGYEKCIAVHAEANAIIQAGGRERCLGATMYVNSHNRGYNGAIYNEGMGDFPCNNCARLIINAGVEYVVHMELIEPIAYHIPTLVKEGKLW